MPKISPHRWPYFGLGSVRTTGYRLADNKGARYRLFGESALTEPRGENNVCVSKFNLASQSCLDVKSEVLDFTLQESAQDLRIDGILTRE